MNRIDRLFGILTLLQSRKYVTAEKIAEKFNMSIRTVYRDVKALTESGIPVQFEATRGYCIMQGYFLAPVAFTNEEANALLLTQSVAQVFTDRSIHKHYATALNKVKSVLRYHQKEKLEALDNNIRMQAPGCFNQNYEYLSPLQEAISSQKLLVLDYKNQKNEVSKREVEAIGLIFYAFNWHLIAWCHKNLEYRDFRVSRILKIQSTGAPFTRPDHISVSDYMKSLPVNY